MRSGRPSRSGNAALAALAVLAGCGGDEETPGAETSEASELPADGDDGPEKERPPKASRHVRFASVGKKGGLESFLQHNGNPEKPYIIESIGGGVAFLDFDGDGHLDVYLSNGSALEEFVPGTAPRDALFRGDGAGKFRDVSAEAGIGVTGWTNGVHVADVDADGRPDVYLTNAGANMLLRKRRRALRRRHDRGEGRRGVVEHRRVLPGQGPRRRPRPLRRELHSLRPRVDRREPSEPPVPRRERLLRPERPAGCGRRLLPQRRGVFANASEEAGITGPELHGFAAVAFDHDFDGLVDVFVANDSQPNLLWKNQPDGTFVDRAFQAGVARSKNGTPQASMGVAVGDANGDLVDDLFVTNFSEDYYAFYVGDATGAYRDDSYRAKLALATRNFLGWGTAFFDVENDGDLDLFASNGHVYPQVDLFDLGTSYFQRNQVFVNDGEGNFVEAPARRGLTTELCSRGAAFGDYDDDGDIDVVINNLDGPPTLLRNDTPSEGNWIKLRLIGAGGNRDAIGARLVVTAGGKAHGIAVGTQDGFLSSNDPRLHVGLGAAETVEQVRITWPDGSDELVEGLGVGRLVTIEQGKGVVADEEW